MQRLRQKYNMKIQDAGAPRVVPLQSIGQLPKCNVPRMIVVIHRWMNAMNSIKIPYNPCNLRNLWTYLMCYIFSVWLKA